MSAHFHSCDVCFRWNVPCDVYEHSDVDPPHVCERCAVYRATFEADPLFLALRDLNSRLEWYDHREGCPRYEHAECCTRDGVYECNDGMDEAACKAVDCYECDRDRNAAGILHAFELRIAELVASGAP